MRPVLLTAVGLALVFVTPANAQTADCPADPGVAPGTWTVAETETREIVRAVVATCAALAERADESTTASGDVLQAVIDGNDNLATIATDGTVTANQSAASRTALDAIGVYYDAGPLAVADADATLATETASVAQREVGWFLAGLLVSLFAGYIFYRQVFPRA